MTKPKTAIIVCASQAAGYLAAGMETDARRILRNGVDNLATTDPDDTKCLIDALNLLQDSSLNAAHNYLLELATQ